MLPVPTWLLLQRLFCQIGSMNSQHGFLGMPRADIVNYFFPSSEGERRYIISVCELCTSYSLLISKTQITCAFSFWFSITAILYDGRLDERKAMKEELSGEGKFNVLLTHYDLIMRDKAFLKKIQWKYLIVDEGHRLKNHESALARTLDNGYDSRQHIFMTWINMYTSLKFLVMISIYFI